MQVSVAHLMCTSVLMLLVQVDSTLVRYVETQFVQTTDSFMSRHYTESLIESNVTLLWMNIVMLALIILGLWDYHDAFDFDGILFHTVVGRSVPLAKVFAALVAWRIVIGAASRIVASEIGRPLVHPFLLISLVDEVLSQAFSAVIVTRGVPTTHGLRKFTEKKHEQDAAHNWFYLHKTGSCRMSFTNVQFGQILSVQSLRNIHLIRIAMGAHFISEMPGHSLGVI